MQSVQNKINRLQIAFDFLVITKRLVLFKLNFQKKIKLGQNEN